MEVFLFLELLRSVGFADCLGLQFFKNTRKKDAKHQQKTRLKIRQLPTKKASKIDRHFQYGDSLANFRTSRKEEEMCKNTRKNDEKHQQNKW